jgi:hypothetical protein
MEFLVHGARNLKMKPYAGKSAIIFPKAGGLCVVEASKLVMKSETVQYMS